MAAPPRASASRRACSSAAHAPLLLRDEEQEALSLRQDASSMSRETPSTTPINAADVVEKWRPSVHRSCQAKI